MDAEDAEDTAEVEPISTPPLPDIIWAAIAGRLERQRIGGQSLLLEAAPLVAPSAARRPLARRPLARRAACFFAASLLTFFILRRGDVSPIVPHLRSTHHCGQLQSSLTHLVILQKLYRKTASTHTTTSTTPRAPPTRARRPPGSNGITRM